MKNKKMIVILSVILCVLLVVIFYFKFNNSNKNNKNDKNTESNVVADSVKFKEEYEKLNDKEATQGKKYKKLEISDNNPIKYSNYDEIIDVIKNKTGIIYLGFPECPWCRTALPVLFEAANDNNIDTIYYLNIKNERDSYIVKDGKLTYATDANGKEIKGTKGYFKLLEALDKHLSDYVITKDEKTYKVGEKRIYAPSVIFVRDGKVLGIHVSTVKSQSNGYEALTEECHKELYSIYDKYIEKMKSESCSINTAC